MPRIKDLQKFSELITGSGCCVQGGNRQSNVKVENPPIYRLVSNLNANFRGFPSCLNYMPMIIPMISLNFMKWLVVEPDQMLALFPGPETSQLLFILCLLDFSVWKYVELVAIALSIGNTTITTTILFSRPTF